MYLLTIYLRDETLLTLQLLKFTKKNFWMKRNIISSKFLLSLFNEKKYFKQIFEKVKLRQMPYLCQCSKTCLCFQSRSESMISVCSNEGGRYGTVTVKGDVQFGMQYNIDTQSLELSVRQCRDLAAVDAKRNRSDP